MIVVSDTTPLITLLKVQHLDLLQAYFGEAQIPKAVYIISAEVFGNGIDMWLRSQGDMVELL